jgi:uncharacterized membrane protein YfcA
MIETLTLMAIGALAGLLAGLFGVGGGLVVVPALAFWLPSKGLPASEVLHIAVATSLAAICVTAMASAWAHLRRGAVDLRTLGWLAPGLLLGSGGGALLIAHVPRTPLTVFVAGFCAHAAWQILRPARVQPTQPSRVSAQALLPAGLGIGAVSAAVGIGGGSLTVPFLHRAGVELRRAIATSAAAGLPIALAGTLGYLYAPSVPGMSAWSVGLVDFKLALAIGSLSVLTAPIGAMLAHRWPMARLKKGFAIWLLLVAVMLVVKL